MRHPARAGVKGNRILLFAAYPWVISSMVAHAVLLRRLGHHPTVLWTSVVDGIQDADPGTVAAMEDEMGRMTGPLAEAGIAIERLDTRPSTPLTRSFMARIFDAAMRDCFYTYHMDRSEVMGDPLFYSFRFQRDLRLACNFIHYMRRHTFDTIINPNGTVNEFGVVNICLDELGLPHYNIEAANVRRLFVSANKPIGMLSLDGAWNHEAPHVCDEAVEAFYSAAWEERAGLGYWQHQCVLPLQTTPVDAATDPFVPETAGRRLALLCTTVAWDSISLASTSAFDSMLDWVARVIEHVRRHDRLSLVVRIHPAESHCPQGVYTEAFLTERFPTLPPHIVVAPPKAPVNTYALMRRADIGLTYMSTTGFEMASMGIPVLTPLQAHYTGKGFAAHAPTAADYFADLDALADPGRDIRLSPEQIGQAKCFYEMFFNRVQRPVPWSFQRLAGEYGRPSMEEVLADPDFLGARRTFEQLATPFTDYEGLVVIPRDTAQARGIRAGRGRQDPCTP